ncbi:RHS repeat-associated core domain-containing protein [Deminuibacter soli]|uniref:RHS repeat-associated core domain-containing protein n=1 Tax=Deminuibacter soli TaxID=2291815 RepID=UPI0021D10D2A|nr:RHS repeat-associated core domain-containing protein [Deminuibacter soli]
MSATDYYPFGMEMPGRVYSGGKYRYGFNGKENDNEMKGEGNNLDFGDRLYDSRVGRWLSVDAKAKKYTAWSPYNFGLNNPVENIDPNGNDVIPSNLKVYRYSDGSIKVVGVVKISIQIINLLSKSNNDVNIETLRSTTESNLINYLYGNVSGNQTAPFSTEMGRLNTIKTAR